MLKDPNHADPTPYDVLRLGPNASRDAVMKALPRFMKDPRNLRNIGQAQEAVRSLKTPKARAAVDLWYYSVAAPPDGGAPPLQLQDLVETRPLDAAEFCTDFSLCDLSREVRPVAPPRFEIEDLPQFRGAVELPQPEFDR